MLLLHQHRLANLIAVIVLITFTCPLLAYSQECSNPPLKKSEILEQTTVSPVKERPNDYIRDVIEPNRIGFFPTRSVRQELGNKRVPREIIDVLTKYSQLFLQVSEFECRNCPTNSRDGITFAQQVLDEIFQLKLSQNPNDPLFGKTFSSQLGPKGGYDRNESCKVNIFAYGVIKRERQHHNIDVRLSYVDVSSLGVTPISRQNWTLRFNSNRQATAEQIANWIIESLRSAVR